MEATCVIAGVDDGQRGVLSNTDLNEEVKTVTGVDENDAEPEDVETIQDEDKAIQCVWERVGRARGVRPRADLYDSD